VYCHSDNPRVARTVSARLVAEGIVGTGCRADPSRILLGLMSLQGGYRYVVAAVWIVGTRGGTHSRRIVVAGGSNIRNVGVVRS
jgi:hypothetical protein